MATWSIAGLTGLVYVAQLILGSSFTTALAYFPPLTAIEPWRMVTSIFVHSTSPILGGIPISLHIIFNMLALLLFGPLLESFLGRWRFVVLYLLAGLGGSIAVLWLAPATLVVGASGAIFGLFGAYFVLVRKLGGNPTSLVIVIGINLAIGFMPGSGISWQAHVGGLLVGALVAWVFVRTRGPRQRGALIGSLAAVVGGLIALTIAGVFVLFR